MRSTSSATHQKTLKRVCLAALVFLMLFAVYFCTAVPLDAWLFRTRKGGVPAWVEYTQIPLEWLREHNSLAHRFFAWQSERERLRDVDEGRLGSDYHYWVMPPK